ncbi:MAG TPA: hypothetical protein VD994_09190 [Prosthecobacter sp.]|nr:hypothetical protein [Prosthecobacter sp.]
MLRFYGDTGEVSLTPPADPNLADYDIDDGYPQDNTIVTPFMMHQIVEEIATVIEDAGLTLSASDQTQLNAAIDAKITAAVAAISPTTKFIRPDIVPYYNDANSWIFPSGMSALSSDGAMTITLAADQTCSLAAAGVNGLDTGAEANNTFYFAYLIGNHLDGVTYPPRVLWSANATTPTLPANYTKSRRLNFAVLNDGSGNLRRQKLSNWPYATIVEYDVRTTYSNGSAFVNGDHNVLSAGAATSMTDVGLSAYVPSISNKAKLSVMADHNGTGTAYYYLREKGASSNGNSFVAWGAIMDHNFWLPTDSSRVIQYQKYTDTGGAGPAISLDVAGYQVTAPA